MGLAVLVHGVPRAPMPSSKSLYVLGMGLSLATGAACDRLGGAPATANTAVDPASHPWFPIQTGFHALGSGTPPITCDDCHGAYATFAQFSCLNCHAHDPAPMNQAHAGMPGYRYDSAACLSCHPSGTSSLPGFPGSDGGANADGGVFDHSAFFPIASGSHANTACTVCHDQQVQGTTDFTQANCLACHAHDQAPMDGAHGTSDAGFGVPGYQWANASCQSCHPNDVIPAFSHPAFPIATASHPSSPCTSCHTAGAARSDLSALLCASCHVALDANLVSKHTTTPSDPNVTVDPGEISASDSRTCLLCHADDPGTGFNPLPATTPPDAVSTNRHSFFGVPHHGAGGCTTGCHPTQQNGASFLRTDKPWALDFKARGPCPSGTAAGCYACHRNANCSG